MIVCHTAEGAQNYQDLGAFFGHPSSGVSSHVGIDDTPGTIGEYVHRDKKAWTQGNANPYSVAAELCAFAEWDAAEWSRHPHMLANAAAWVAEEAAAFAIPLVSLSAYEAQNGAAGVCQHVDLGAAGGGHWDCGPGFPIEDVMDMARGDLVPVPELGEGGEDVFIRSKDGKVRWAIYDGKHTYWRLIPPGLEQNIADRVIDDPNDSWLNLWDH